MNAAAITDFTAAIDHRDEVLARKRLEERVALLEEFNRLLVESSGDCILIVDFQFRFFESLLSSRVTT